jgi:hypothetical protein
MANDDCPLSPAEQTRNLLLFGACTGLIYLAAPIVYVGVTQASLFNKLGASNTVANLPGTIYFLMTGLPVLLAWCVPYASYLKRNLVTCYAVVAVTLAAIAVLLPSDVSDEVKIAAVILQAGVTGGALPSAVAFMWEVIGRGVSGSRRGPALGLAFGAGPVLAAGGSYGSHLLLNGRLEFPLNFATLYGLAVPAMAVAAILASRLVVPLPDREVSREPFLQSVFGGLWNFLADRVLLTATVVTILVYTGNTIISNMNLYSEEALGEAPEKFAGLQNTFRFGFKAVAGVLLGWLLTKTNPKAGILATTTLFIAAMGWALTVTGKWYLVAFGIYGAGELIGVYAPNYILSSSRPRDMRRNMAIVTMLMLPAAPFGTFFGAIADHYGERFGKAAGFRISFAVCAGIMVVGISLAALVLPSRPRVKGQEVDDREQGSDAKCLETGIQSKVTGIRIVESGIKSRETESREQQQSPDP